MKIYLLLYFIASTCAICTGQHYISLDTNNVRANFNDIGAIVASKPNSSAGYEFPKDSNTHLIYNSGLWVGGLEQDSTLHITANLYQQDWVPGPVANDYNSTYYQTHYDSCLWTVSITDINYHLAHYNDIGYVPSQNILNWPALGSPANGIAMDQAPFVDLNNDGVYNPYMGDYPKIKGDKVVYIILNDDHDPPVQGLGATNLGVEVHLMFYQYVSADNDVNSTTYGNIRIINRSDTNYTDLIMGLWMDFDIGQASNDYVGTDSLRNFIYGYNGEAFDTGQAGQNGYGSSPPAIGVKFLNETIGAAVYHNNGGGPNGDPSNPMSYYFYMQAIWANGSPMTYGGTGFGGTDPTHCVLTGNPFFQTGWNEVSEGNPPGDRRILLASPKYDLPVDAVLCFDIAIITNNAGSGPFENAHLLSATADVVQDFYNDNIGYCWNVNPPLLIDETKTSIKVFPNPSKGQFTINSSENGTVRIYDLKGRLIKTQQKTSAQQFISMNETPGTYIIELSNDNGVWRECVVVL